MSVPGRRGCVARNVCAHDGHHEAKALFVRVIQQDPRRRWHEPEAGAAPLRAASPQNSAA